MQKSNSHQRKQPKSPTTEGVPETDPRSIQEAIHAHKIKDIQFRTHVAQSETKQWYDAEDNAHFSYQPGSLWIHFEDKYRIPYIVTPEISQGIIGSPKPTDGGSGKLVSDDFYYKLYEAYNHVSTLPEDSTQQIPFYVKDRHVNAPSERYHLQTILFEAFDPDFEMTLYTNLILQKARSIFGDAPEDITLDTKQEANTVEENEGMLPCIPQITMGDPLPDCPRDFDQCPFNSEVVTSTVGHPTAPAEEIDKILSDVSPNTTIYFTTTSTNPGSSDVLKEVNERGAQLSYLISEEAIRRLREQKTNSPFTPYYLATRTDGYVKENINTDILAFNDNVYAGIRNKDHQFKKLHHCSNPEVASKVINYIKTEQEKGKPIGEYHRQKTKTPTA